jgi:hypothetical protein
MAIGAAFARDIIEHWVGKHGILPSSALVWALFCWNAVAFIEQPFGFLLSGISEVRRLTFYTIVSSIITPPLMYLMLSYYGPTGAVLGMVIGFLPTLFFGNIYEICRVFRLLRRTKETKPEPVVDVQVAMEQGR